VARARAMFLAKRYTMTTPERCKSLWDQCFGVLEAGVPGSFVECGVWRGGAAAIMGLALRHHKQKRLLHLFDSFEGLPEPTETDGTRAREYSGGKASGALSSVGQCQAGLEEVRGFLHGKLGIDPTSVIYHVGWFQNTLPKDSSSLGPIAVLRLDGDWYESTKICLEHLYPLLSPGGVLVLDDYFVWAGCAKATDEFRQANGITSPMHRIDQDAVYWTKG
jgi:O-methyltransferase